MAGTPAGTAAVAATQLSSVRFGDLTFTTGGPDAAMAMLHEWRVRPNRAGVMVGFLNPHVYNGASAAPAAHDFLERCSYVCVDGVGVAAAARLLYHARLPRVVATDLFEALMLTTEPPLDAVLIGATAPEVEAAAARLNARAGGVNIVATLDGFRDPAAYDAFLHDHRAIDAVLVGAGTPRSEEILLQAHQVCPHALAFHIGAGTIKLYAGTKRRAPRLMSRLGLEWIHRIVFEPHTRPRYLSGAWQFGRDVLRHRRERVE